MILPAGTKRLAELEAALQKQADVLSRLQAPLHAVILASQQTQQLSSDITRLEMQLAELKTQVQAEAKARHLLSKLSGMHSSGSSNQNHDHCAITNTIRCAYAFLAYVIYHQNSYRTQCMHGRL